MNEKPPEEKQPETTSEDNLSAYSEEFIAAVLSRLTERGRLYDFNVSDDEIIVLKRLTARGDVKEGKGKRRENDPHGPERTFWETHTKD